MILAERRGTFSLRLSLFGYRFNFLPTQNPAGGGGKGRLLWLKVGLAQGSLAGSGSQERRVSGCPPTRAGERPTPYFHFSSRFYTIFLLVLGQDLLCYFICSVFASKHLI